MPRLPVLLPLLLLAGADASVVPNPAFEIGADGQPLGWQLVSGLGDWQVVDGDAALVTHGDEGRTSYWHSIPLALQPGSLYRLRFRARRLHGEAAGGTVMSGTTFANRDLGPISPEWRRFSSYFVTPAVSEARSAPSLRFGQWHLPGAVAFDDVELHATQPVHLQLAPGLWLGEGESIEAGRYHFQAPHRTPLANFSRPLQTHDAGFNTHRWVFGRQQQVTYRHEIGAVDQQRARVAVNVNYRTGGRLVIEARTRESDTWTAVGRLDSVRSASFSLPDSLFPAARVFVRLRAEDARRVGDDADPGSFQVDDYQYHAELLEPLPDATGETRLVTVTAAHDPISVLVVDAGSLQPGVADTVVVGVSTQVVMPLRYRAVVRDLGVAPADGGWRSARLRPGETQLLVPYQVTGTGDRVVHLQLDRSETDSAGATGKALWRAEIDVHASVLHADHYGERLATGPVELWWASSGWKVSRTRVAPSAEGTAMRIEAAGNETEAAQLVLRPHRELVGLRVRTTDLAGPERARIPAGRIEILRVGYVQVRQPSDGTGEAGAWPDPLLPFDAAIDPPRGQNQPLWVRVSVPRGTPAGVYAGVVSLTADDYEATVPLRVTVFGFDLPDRMTCETAFGFSPGAVWRYHGVDDDGQRRQLLDRYFDSFRRHHISPYDPAPLDPVQVTWPDLSGRAVPRGEVIEPVVDAAAWDAAMSKAIDEYHFNTFQLRIPGMGGGTYIDRREPELRGYGADTPQYQALFRGYGRAIERHLMARGWLDEAFVYWFDEPAPRDYDFVMEGFRRLETAAPGLRRMLTEQVEAELIGGPTLWCPVIHGFDSARATPRKAAGERFWWYVCTVPKAPHVGLFIDHAGVEMRTWLWQTWAHGVDGILVWATNYWSSGAAYPGSLQDPYADPMSWQSTYNAPVGTRRPWGNGDGRFLYPPPEATGSAARPVLAGPVESVRWEMLRDGIEDYEYLALLRRALTEAEALSASERQAWSQLLEVPPEISASRTRFAKDPAPIEERRRQLAAALEELSRR